MTPLSIALPDLTLLQKTWVGVLLFLLNGWAIYRALRHGHGVQGTLAWIFAVIALPFLGAIAFFVLASPSVKRITLRKRRASAHLRQWLKEHGGPATPPDPIDGMIDLA